MCVHEIQFLCERSTVIYTSIAILHWWFCESAKYPDSIARGGDMVSETHQCYAPIHSMQLCVLRCGNHMRSVRWNTTVCRPVYHDVPENSSTKKSWHTRCSLFCCSYERFFIHGPNIPICLVVTRGYSGYDRSPVYSVSIYPFYRRCAADQCTWTCGDMQLYDNSGTSKVIA